MLCDLNVLISRSSLAFFRPDSCLNCGHAIAFGGESVLSEAFVLEDGVCAFSHIFWTQVYAFRCMYAGTPAGVMHEGDLTQSYFFFIFFCGACLDSLLRGGFSQNALSVFAFRVTFCSLTRYNRFPLADEKTKTTPPSVHHRIHDPNHRYHLLHGEQQPWQ